MLFISGEQGHNVRIQRVRGRGIIGSTKKYGLGMVSIFLSEGLNMFDGANLTLISDEDHDK